MNKIVLATALLGSVAFSASASAATALNLNGATVTASLRYPDMATVYAGPVSTTVGAGVEFTSGSFSPAPQSIDIGASTISIFTNGTGTYSNTTFNGFELDFTGFTGSLDSLRVDASSTFQPVNFSVSGNSVFVNLSGETVRANDVLNISAVPEPATWAMMFLGLGMIGFAARARSQKVRVTFA
jgi:hypothetical protein